MSSLFIPPLLGDGAVFPKGLPICIYGKSNMAGEVVLTLSDGTRRTASFSPENGSFSALLAPVDFYTEEAQLTVTAADEVYTARHIAIGIVILAAGQSNMEFLLKDADQPHPLYPTDKMRFFTEKHALNAEKGEVEKPISDFWYAADGKTERDFSAIGYFVAEMLSRTISVTVGVVSCNQGASRIEAWLSPNAAKKSGVDANAERYVDQRYIFNKDHWLYYNKYLNVAAYTYSAVLWYQGESNTGFGEGEEYRRYLRVLIDEWRANNPNKDLPFYLVELAPFDSVLAGWAPEPLGAWAPVREAILSLAESEREVYAVSLSEVKNVAEIHPTNKHPVAEKLARAILATQYGYDIVYTGPRFLSAKREENALTVTFSYAERLAFLDENGKPAPACDTYFHFADESREAAFPTASGNTLRVLIPEGAVAFSMGYQNAPCHNLYSEKEYLASPFFLSLKDKECHDGI